MASQAKILIKTKIKVLELMKKKNEIFDLLKSCDTLARRHEMNKSLVFEKSRNTKKWRYNKTQSYGKFIRLSETCY